MATLMYNNVTPEKIYYANTAVKNVYYNNVKVWSEPSIPLSGTLAVGNIVTFDNKQWRVVHNDGNKWYLAHETITELIYWNTQGINVESFYHVVNSNIPNKCNSWMHDNISALAQKYMIDVTVNGSDRAVNPTNNNIMTSKVFIPNYTMVVDEFSYYVKTTGAGTTSYTNRIAYYNGEATGWWISTGRINDNEERIIHYVYKTGSVAVNKFVHEKYTSTTYCTSQLGFRPHICIVSP